MVDINLPCSLITSVNSEWLKDFLFGLQKSGERENSLLALLFEFFFCSFIFVLTAINKLKLKFFGVICGVLCFCHVKRPLTR